MAWRVSLYYEVNRLITHAKLWGSLSPSPKKKKIKIPIFKKSKIVQVPLNIMVLTYSIEEVLFVYFNTPEKLAKNAIIQ